MIDASITEHMQEEDLMKRSWRLLGLVVLAAVICLAAVTLLRPAVHEAEMAGGTDSTQEAVQEPKPDTAEDGP